LATASNSAVRHVHGCLRAIAAASGRPCSSATTNRCQAGQHAHLSSSNSPPLHSFQAQHSLSMNTSACPSPTIAHMVHPSQHVGNVSARVIRVAQWGACHHEALASRRAHTRLPYQHKQPKLHSIEQSSQCAPIRQHATPSPPGAPRPACRRHICAGHVRGSQWGAAARQGHHCYAAAMPHWRADEHAPANHASNTQHFIHKHVSACQTPSPSPPGAPRPACRQRIWAGRVHGSQRGVCYNEALKSRRLPYQHKQTTTAHHQHPTLMFT
jgi:hypothetical protein